jgi:hypothetical protein
VKPDWPKNQPITIAMQSFGEQLAKRDYKKEPKEIKTFERVDKNAPREISSKIFVPKVKQLDFGVSLPKPKDPRFDHGSVDSREKSPNFVSPYRFLVDLQKNEINHLKEVRKRKRDEGDEEAMFNVDRAISKKSTALNNIKKSDKLKEIRRNFKKEQIKQIAEGKTPYYINTKKIKELSSRQRETNLKSQGKLEEYERRKQVKKNMKENAFKPPLRKEK